MAVATYKCKYEASPVFVGGYNKYLFLLILHLKIMFSHEYLLAEYKYHAMIH